MTCAIHVNLCTHLRRERAVHAEFGHATVALASATRGLLDADYLIFKLCGVNHRPNMYMCNLCGRESLHNQVEPITLIDMTGVSV